MTTLRYITVVFVLIGMSIASKAQTADEKLALDAGKLFEQQEYLRAYPMYSQLVSLYPNHPEYNYKFGACGIYADPDKMNAVRYLQGAIKKGETSPMVFYYLGKALHLNYQFKEAITAYESFMRFADEKVVSKTDARREVETCIYGANLLSNIKDVTVLSKTETDRTNFFRYYNLEGIGGKILAVPDALMSKLDKKSKEPGVMYYPGNGTTVYFSSLGKDGKTGKDIYKAEVLSDGTFSQAQKLNININSIYDEDYCFMHSDGKTLYFASRGHNSMGGYDIFKSELDPSTGEFGPVINLDFAINTPDDDIFYIADKDNHAAFFASGRSSDNNHLNVYQVLVETNPIQVVYFKGAFNNTVDSEELAMSTKILDAQGNRMVCEGNSDQSNGKYIFYVPKSGEYRYKVRTAMSPEVFDVVIDVPQFNKPVAIRQEMTLKNESGKFILDVQTYFDQPLEEDLTLLAAEMLRKKSKLDVSGQAEVTAMDSDLNSPGQDMSTYAKDMDHVAINAGFNEGTTVTSVMSEIQDELKATQNSISASQQLQLVALSHAAKCQQDADALMKEAEDIRARIKAVETPQDADDLRKSVQLIDAAEAKMREAKSALLIHKSEAGNQSELSQTKKDQEQRLAALKTASDLNNYESTLTLLKSEKEFRNAQSEHRDSRKDSIRVALNNVEKELSQKENQLIEMRKDVTVLEKQKDDLANKISVTEKSKEKEMLREEFIQLSSALDSKRTQLKKFESEVGRKREELSMLTAQLNLEESLEKNPGLGISQANLTALSPTEQRLLEMRVDEILTRKDAIAITDTALLSYIENETLVPASTEPSRPLPTSPLLVAESRSEFVKEITGNVAAPFSTSVALFALQEEYQRISENIAKGTATAEDQADISELSKRIEEKKQELKISDAQLEFDQQAQQALKDAEPSYQDNILAINNNGQHEMKQALQELEYNNQVLIKLEEARKVNAQSIHNGSTAEEVNMAAEKDAALAAAIAEVKSNAENIQSIRAAYEVEIKSIIENDAVYRDKLVEQLGTTQDFITTLDEAILLKQDQLSDTQVAEDKKTILHEIDVLNNDKLQAQSKVAAYQNDILLLGSASEPVVTEVKTSVANPQIQAETTSALSVEELKSEAKAIQSLFKAKDESQSIFAYESGVFAELVAKFSDDAHPIQNIEKIQEINDQIFLLEAEMENEKSKGALKKLDYKAEQLYFQRSQLEIANAASIAYITQEAYVQESSISEQAIAENQEFIQSRMVLRDEIARLQTESERLMDEAAQIRFNAPSIQDEIEKADAYRTAFAKEALAMEQMRQIQQICRNAAPLSTYSEQDLVMLRTGTVPAHLLADAQRRDDASSLDVSLNKTVDETELTIANPSEDATAANSANSPTSPENQQLSTGLEAETNRNDESTSNTPIELDAVVLDEVREGSSVQNNSTFEDEKQNQNQNQNENENRNANAVNTEEYVIEPSSDQRTDERSTMASSEENHATSDASSESSSNNQASGDSTPQADSLNGENSMNVTAENPSTNDNFEVADAQSIATVPTPSAESEEESYNAADFYYSMPSQVKGTIFQLTSQKVYSDERPIPVDATLPQGLYFKVQVGAFRNRIPQDLFEGFAPICGETVNNGITRYTAGFFVEFDAANEVKKQIRSMGYSDAFIVAFKDGKRIPMYEALGYGSQQEMDTALGIVPVTSDISQTQSSNNPSNGASSDNKSTNQDSNLNNQMTSEVTNSGATTSAAGASDASLTQDQTPPARSEDQIMLEPVEIGYYKPSPAEATAQEVEVIEGLFYTVQVGVFSKPVSADRLFNISPLNSELTDTKKIRYTSGQFTSLADAVQKRNETRSSGITDAFITAYYNGRRITLGEADLLLAEKGPGILKK